MNDLQTAISKLDALEAKVATLEEERASWLRQLSNSPNDPALQARLDFVEKNIHDTNSRILGLQTEINLLGRLGLFFLTYPARRAAERRRAQRDQTEEQFEQTVGSESSTSSTRP